jgi:indolepyruvate decarboxylase
MVSVSAELCVRPTRTQPDTDPDALEEALAEAVGIMNAAERPVIIAGVELHRFGLQHCLLELLDKTGYPVACTLLSKSVIRETHPQYLGIYEGAMGREDVREYVETSDCLILLGAFMTDINLGVYTAQLDQRRSISATSEIVSISFHSYEGLSMEPFLRGLLEAPIRRRSVGAMPHPVSHPQPDAAAGTPVTVEFLFRCLNSFLEDNTVVIADPGDAMFAATDITIHNAAEFLAPAYYTSLGFAVPAALGVQLAKPTLRPLVLVGDGAFQMTGMELATIARFGLDPIVIVLNNRGYGTERPMVDGGFNDVHEWDYSRLPDVLQAGKGYCVRTEDELENALSDAKCARGKLCILDVHLAPDDRSIALKRLTAALGKNV